PLSSESSLRLALVELRPEMAGSTDELWRAAERRLFESWPAVGLDECVALRDRLWFGRGSSDTLQNQAFPLTDYLRALAADSLELRGGVAVPSARPEVQETFGDASDVRRRTAWRWLSFALPPDLLLAALAGERAGPVSVETLQPVISRHLADHGFAETHLHLGAAVDFPRLWVLAHWELLQTSCKPRAFCSPGAELREGMDLGPWLLRAFLARHLLASFLGAGLPRSEDEEFARFLNRHEGDLGDLLGASALATLVTALRELECGSLEPGGPVPSRPEHSALRSIYRRLVGRPRKLPHRPEELWSTDPIAPLARRSVDHGGTPETWFVTRALRHIDDNPKDRYFARLFWQVTRVRCLLYRHVVQRPLTPGLQWFLRSFDRMKPARRSANDRFKMECALELSGGGKGLRSLEIRTSPEPTLNGTANLVRSAEAAQANSPRPAGGRLESPLLKRISRELAGTEDRGPDRPEIGLVLHFPRDRGGEWSKGRPEAHWRGSHADPLPRTWARKKQPNSAGYRYSSFYRSQRRKARALSRYLLSFPGSLGVIRGLDLCADETGVPTWVLAPLLRHVRDAGLAASAALQTDFGVGIPPLRSTIHAGEDFIHLSTGLRQIDQSIDRFQLGSGDRIGHAIALGVDAQEWAARAGRLAMPREDRLFDLVWEWRRHTGGDRVPAGRIETVRREVARLSEDMFGEPMDPSALASMEDMLHNELGLRLLGFPTGPVPCERPGPRESVRTRKGDEEAFDLALRFLTSATAFTNGRQTILVEPKEEGEVLRALQDDLRRKVGMLGLTVEVNPSSNLLIGHLGEMDRHPLWRLRPVRPDGDLKPLSLCIGSDDPITFATCLLEEYQLLHDALLGSGHSEADAHRWIDDVRRRGLDGRFTVAVDGRGPELGPWRLGAGPAIQPPP
ncbi:MAG: hypothetical protein ACOC92_02270, partial [bacterium]